MTRLPSGISCVCVSRLAWYIQGRRTSPEDTVGGGEHPLGVDKAASTQLILPVAPLRRQQCLRTPPQVNTQLTTAL